MQFLIDAMAGDQLQFAAFGVVQLQRALVGLHQLDGGDEDLPVQCVGIARLDQLRLEPRRVGLGVSGIHALEMISEIVHEAACPVIALLESADEKWVNEAAKRGIFAYIVNGDPAEMQSAIDITIRRYAEYANLEGAFARRAVIERAKGILMARQTINDQKAFELLRTQSRRSGSKLVDVAQAVIESHMLLVPPSA